MSGGMLNYFYATMQDHVGDFGDRELDDLVSDLADLFHAREWYLSGDTCEGTWNEARDAFKAKWFREGAREDRIEKYISDFSDEIRKSFGISEKYCKNCKHWLPKNDSAYQRCEYHESCLMHRSESCDKWELRDGGETVEG